MGCCMAWAGTGRKSWLPELETQPLNGTSTSRTRASGSRAARAKQPEQAQRAKPTINARHEGSRLYKKGHFTAAAQSFSRARDELQDASGATTVEYALVLYDIGLCKGMQGLHANAMECFEEALPALKGAGTDAEEAYARLLRHMGTCCGHQRRYQEAMAFFSRAQTVFEGSSNSKWRKEPEYASLLCDAGMCCYNDGHPAEAMAFFSKARVAYEEAGATWSPGCATMLFAMGACMYDEGNKTRAAELFTSAKAAFEASGMTGTTNYLGLLHALGMCYLGNESKRNLLFSEASPHFECQSDVISEYTMALDFNWGVAALPPKPHHLQRNKGAACLPTCGRIRVH